jgi:hypothetical protein
VDGEGDGGASSDDDQRMDPVFTTIWVVVCLLRLLYCLPGPKVLEYVHFINQQLEYSSPHFSINMAGH